MDSNKIRNLAFGARDALRREARARIEAVLAEGSTERLERANDVSALENSIKEQGLEAVVDSSAYTWFNRLCALRFMDAHGYTPTGAVTPRPGSTQPAILADAAQGIFDPDWGLDRLTRDHVMALLSGASPASNPTEAAYAELLRGVCAHYAEPMSYLFGSKIASPLAMPQGLLSEGSILRRIVSEMDDEACESVEVLGWLYQFYVAERKDEFFNSKKKAKPEDIAPATQLFTPDWIVRYLVENSAGRLWMLNNPHSSLAQNMEYYIAPEGKHEDTIKVYSPEEITVCDPACGSGHILVYAFDLLYEIYLEEGYPAESIPELILTNNLAGMEIDRRAAEIAMFALEMKAREKDPSFFSKQIDADVCVLEPVIFGEGELDGCELLEAHSLLDAFAHMTECGSLYVPEPTDLPLVEKAIDQVRTKGELLSPVILDKLELMRDILEALSRKFSCVVANPPYMGSGKFDSWMSKWAKRNYPDEKSDLCTCFIKRGFSLAAERGYESMITASSWMFTSSYEKMRKALLSERHICSMIQQSTHGFAGVTVPTVMFVLESGHNDSAAQYVRLEDFDRPQWQQPKALEAIKDPACEWRYTANQRDFSAIPGSPIAYWASEAARSAFVNFKPLREYAMPRQGLATGDNNRFLRLWWEPAYSSIGFGCSNRDEAAATGLKWFPCNKGGSFRKWYGNNWFVLNWGNDGFELRNFEKSVIRNSDYYYRNGMTWGAISSSSLSMRYSPAGSISESKGAMAFAQDDETLRTCIALCNTSLVDSLMSILSPTLDYHEGPMGNLPVALPDASAGVEGVAETNISISRSDWDSFETSWNFEWHPLAPSANERTEQLSYNMHHDVLAASVSTIADRFKRWSSDCDARFNELKSNEEELNRIFARIYNMEGEVPIKVPEDKVSVRRADLTRDIKSLVSYGIGCIMGRYSTAKPGLVLADAGQTINDFKEKVPDAPFLPDEDAIIPVLDDEWFADDVVAQFKKWLEVVYGKDTLEENISFIEKALGRDLRTYFVKDFYKDHCATYSVVNAGKRPIYWMFQSPKGGFRALIYMHRYTPSIVGHLLTKYLREYIQKLNASIVALDGSDRATDRRQADTYRATVKELTEWERDVIYPLANERIDIDLDDGVKVNYNKFPHALAKVPGLSEWK